MESGESWVVGKGSEAGDSTAQNKGVHVVGAFVGVDSLQVERVANYVILISNAISTEHVTRLPGNVEGLSTRVPLDHGDHLGSLLVLVLQPSHLKTGLESDGNLSVGISQFLLDQLIARQGLSELLAVKSVLPGSLHA